jgi:Ca2+/Na+ antiporter
LSDNRFFGNITKALGEIGTILAHKDLKHPANFNLMLDILMVIVIVVLLFCDGVFKLKNIPFAFLIITFVVFFFLCAVWVFYCHLRSKQ